METKAHCLARLTWAIFFLFSTVGTASARNIYVDANGTGDYPSIQAAIDDANDGEVVIVKPGTYTGDGNHDIEFQGKAIAVCSEDRPESTIIDCSGADLGFCIIGNEIGHSTIEGLTIRNAVQAAVKVRAVILFRSPGEYQRQYQFSDLPTHTPVTIHNCHIVDNPGGGILLDSHDNITITNCRITANGEAGIWSYRSFPTIRNCLIAANDGHGIRATGATVINCTIAENAGIGLWMYEGSVINTIIWANTQQQIYNPDNNVEVAYSDIQGSFPGTGNIDSNPLFIVARDNYRLQIGSPCIDAGDPDYIPEPNETDLDTNPRISNGRIDIGAYEYQNPRTIHVDANGTGDFATIQAAIDDANDGEVVIVKPGIYTGEGNRDIDFLGKAITISSTDPNDPDIVAATIIDCNGTETEPHRGFIFHGDEGVDSVVSGLTIIKGYGLIKPLATWSLGGGIYCLHSSPVITNCTFSRNVADSGAGMYIQRNSKPTLKNCLFYSNSAIVGGGMSCSDSSPILISCKFSGNKAELFGGGMNNYSTTGDAINSSMIRNCMFVGNTAGNSGGGMFNDSGTGNAINSSTIRDCIFVRNIAGNSGGGMYNMSGTGNAINSLTIRNCIFVGNTAESSGGGMYNNSGTSDAINSSTIRNCIFIGNTAGNSGGGMYNRSNTGNAKTIPSILNCTIADNSAKFGGGMYNRQGISSSITLVKVANSILWNNQGGEIVDEETTTNVSYSCIEGGWEGKDNIDSDPCFAARGYWDPNGTPDDVNDDFWVDGDYHLKSQAGRWDPASERWVQDDVTSPCIDAGDPMSAIGYEPFPNGGIINMGAYGGTAEASKSYFGEPLCGTVIAGDINGDCKVNFADFEIMALHWLQNNR